MAAKRKDIMQKHFADRIYMVYHDFLFAYILEYANV